MKPFQFQQGTAPWQAETGTLLHWYVTVDWDDPRHQPLARLLSDSRQVLRDAGFPLTPVEPEWVHITVDQISRSADRVSTVQRGRLVRGVARRLAGVPPFPVMVGSLLSYPSGVIADLHPDEDLSALHRIARSATRAVLGEDACQYPFGVPHLTTAYAHGEADSDQAQRLLRRVRPGHAPLWVTAVDLVDVTATTSATASAGGKTITWELVERIPLGGGEAGSAQHGAGLSSWGRV
ncbi:2'-5' RNA ligase family protein [Streptomyces sp. NPDC056160]|uniref:2'-5' RNA ligase family protein n=1 Tax=Streptomyces sp. NPDC056160 TaxID=3345731 RepID=UPI0035D8B803